jgi:HEAT repeat protein
MMAVTDITPLVNDLESDNKRKVSQSTDQLKAMGPVVVPALIEALGNRKGLAARLDPLSRRFDKPGNLSMTPPEDPLTQRIELILFDFGPAALPRLAKGLDHPDLRARQASVRVMARHGEAAVDLLVPALANPRSHYLVMDALVEIGQPALEPLAALLRSETPRSIAWNTADLGLCTILDMPTRQEIQAFKRGLTLAWIGWLAAALLFFGFGMWISLSWIVSALVGLLAGYVVWGATVSSTGQSQDDEERSFVAMFKDMLVAAGKYPRKIADYKNRVAARKQLRERFTLPE